MKIPPKFYAKVFVEILREKGSGKKEDLVRRFADIILKNGDAAKIEKIIGYMERYSRELDGRHLLEIQSAHPIADSLQSKIIKSFDKNDEKYDVRSSIDPDLVAGVKFTIDQEKQLDVSLSKIIKNIF